jgi:regulator of protease activity HflC (stomatin/prohibitin superfamily)
MKRFIVLASCVVAFAAVGCRPYDVPEFHEIATSETAILVPLEGDTTKQAAFESEEMLKQHLVSVKRIQIPHRWVSKGRLWYVGEWQSTMRLVKVDRKPVTREWTSGHSTGTATKNEAIWVESSDSVGFSTGVTCTARIVNHTDAIKFLYNYSGVTLEQIMDSEVRARIQKVMADFAAGYNMDELRPKKKEMMNEVEKDVIAFFQERGITITTIGQFGGFTYENPDVQKAIDNVFKAQQDEQVAKAEHKAQLERNKAVKLKADGLAEAVKLEAKGKGEAIQTIADAKAYEIQKAEKSLETYLKLKQLEIDSQRLEKWDGKYPLYYLGGNGEKMPGLILPSPVEARR